MENKLREHWDEIYAGKEIEELGWYEEHPAPSLKLIRQCNLSPDSRILNVGAGAGTLVEELVKLGYTNLIANDLSRKALQKLQARLGGDLSRHVSWIVDDLTKSELLCKLDPIDLWHDRAVLHFFNEPDERDAYFGLLKQLVKAGGYVIVAAWLLLLSLHRL